MNHKYSANFTVTKNSWLVKNIVTKNDRMQTQYFLILF